MTFKLEIECDNAAFGDSASERSDEIVAVLRAAIDKLLSGYNSAKLRDSNGNNVGFYAVIP